MMRVSRFSSDYPNFEFFLLRIHLVNELEGPIDDFEKKSIWAPPYLGLDSKRLNVSGQVGHNV